jgi:hypothetical protein
VLASQDRLVLLVPPLWPLIGKLLAQDPLCLDDAAREICLSAVRSRRDAFFL